MVIRKKNLLEAFQASAPEGRGAAARQGGEKVAAGGPFAPPARTGDRAQPNFASARRRSTLARALSDRTIQLALVVFIVAIGGAYWLGSRNSRSVEARTPSAADEGTNPGALLRSSAPAAAPIPPPDVASASVASANLQTAQAGNADDQAFMDPKNKYTVRLAQYANDDAGQKQARALCEYLRKKEGAPVIRPVSKGKVVIVVAGFAPKIKDLDPLLTFIRGLRGPNSKDEALPFRDAYVVNIDDLVARH